MPEMKTILYVICAVILLILILWWFITSQLNAADKTHPLLFELLEIIRCRFEMGLCLSLYPNPANLGEDVDATIRTQIFYTNHQVCLANHTDVIGSCQITEKSKDNYKCKIPPFKAQPGYYYAFIDSQSTGNDAACVKSNRALPNPQESKSKDVELIILGSN